MSDSGNAVSLCMAFTIAFSSSVPILTDACQYLSVSFSGGKRITKGLKIATVSKKYRRFFRSCASDTNLFVAGHGYVHIAQVKCFVIA